MCKLSSRQLASLLMGLSQALGDDEGERQAVSDAPDPTNGQQGRIPPAARPHGPMNEIPQERMPLLGP